MFSWYTFLAGSIIGIVQVGLGLWIGKLFYDRRKQQGLPNDAASETTEAQESAQRLQKVTTRLQSTVNRVNSDVSNHQVRIEQLTRELHSLKTRSVSVTEEVIWERLNQMVQMTADFSHRLADAESQLKGHVKQVNVIAEAQHISSEDFNNLDVTQSEENSSWRATGVSPLNERKISGGLSESDDVDSMLESVRSRLSEVVGSTTSE